MSEKIWSDDAWEDYLYWQTQDKKTLSLFLNRSKGAADGNGSQLTGIARGQVQVAH